jgi:hypothetical protein
MMDIDIDPIGDGEKQKAQKCPKRRGPRWNSNPRGYEQEIGPNQFRKGRHEPSAALVIGGMGFINTGMEYGQANGPPRWD